jgi:polyisoprenoid-binding protein YceI
MRSALLSLILCVLLAPGAGAESTAYELDPRNAALSFEVRQFGVVWRSGAFDDMDASLVLDPEQPQNARVDVLVRAASLEAGVNTESMRQAFEVTRFPIIRFVSTRIARKGADRARVEGSLTLHGVTRPIALDATLHDAAPLEFVATGTIRRSAFGLNAWSWLSDRVALTIRAPFVPAKR